MLFLNKNQFAVVVLNSHNFIDYEPIFSMQSFLRAAGITAPISIKMNSYSSASYPQDSLAAKLAWTIEDMQNGRKYRRDGKEYPEHMRNLFTPFQNLDLSKGCYSFGMSGPSSLECKQGVVIYP